MNLIKTVLFGAAVVGCSGVAQAGITPGPSGNPSLNLIAFNTLTRAWYIRDTGFLMNDFLPNTVTTRIGDGGVTGNRTPDSGLLLDKNNTANFSDVSFSAWLESQNVADVRWMLSAADWRGSLPTNVHRLITSSANPELRVANAQINNYASTAYAGGLNAFTGDFGLSASGQEGALFGFDTNFGLGSQTLAALDQSVGLFYFSRTTHVGSSPIPAEKYQYENLAGHATVTLEADGDFVYQIPAVPQVPIPAAAWLLGSGLMALAGLSRRRRATV